MEDMSSGQKARVQVQGITVERGRWVLTASDGKKYSFFETTSDKMQETPQYIAFRKQDVKAGDVLDVTFTPRTFISKQSGKTLTAYNLDTLQKVTGAAAEAVKQEAKVDQQKIVVGKCATIFLQARLQSGVSFEEVEKEVGKALSLAVKLVSTTDELYRTDNYDDGESAGNEPVPF